MADPTVLTKRQALFLARAKTITQEQIMTAIAIAEETFDVSPDIVTPEFLLQITKILDSNYSAVVHDANAPA